MRLNLQKLKCIGCLLCFVAFLQAKPNNSQYIKPTAPLSHSHCTFISLLCKITVLNLFIKHRLSTGIPLVIQNPYPAWLCFASFCFLSFTLPCFPASALLRTLLFPMNLGSLTSLHLLWVCLSRFYF